jgi:hypothetical protein
MNNVGDIYKQYIGYAFASATNFIESQNAYKDRVIA